MEKIMKTKLLIPAMALAAAFAANLQAAEVVTSGDVNAISKWYGRAGGLADADRVTGLTTSSTKVGVAYDADVAARTNMQRAQSTPSQVGVTYDADVAARTNMPRGQGTVEQSKAAGIEGAKHN
jgi:opacity protein-like surface antigen